MDEDIFRIVRAYYSQQPMIFTLVNACWQREFAMLSVKNREGLNHRFLGIERQSQAESRLKCSGFLDGRFLYNLYRSVAVYDPSLHFSYIGDPQKQEKMIPWKEAGYKWIRNYDFIIDIDCPDMQFMNTARDDALRVLRRLEGFGLLAYAHFSGMGFHIIVPGITLALGDLSFDSTKDNNVYLVYSTIAAGLKREISEFIDGSIYDEKRLHKIAGTLAIYPDIEPLVTCAFHSVEELMGFDPRAQLYSNWIKNPIKLDVRYYSHGKPLTRPRLPREGVSDILAAAREFGYYELLKWNAMSAPGVEPNARG